MLGDEDNAALVVASRRAWRATCDGVYLWRTQGRDRIAAPLFVAVEARPHWTRACDRAGEGWGP